MNVEVRSTVIPQIHEAWDRWRTAHKGEEPDLIVMHPQTRMTINEEMTADRQWMIGGTSGRQLFGDFNYGTILGMDILCSEDMTPDVFAISRRVPIERIAVPAAPFRP